MLPEHATFPGAKPEKVDVDGQGIKSEQKMT